MTRLWSRFLCWLGWHIPDTVYGDGPYAVAYACCLCGTVQEEP